MQKNDVVQGALVEDLTYEGLGLVRVAGFPVFVENALPGETIDLQLMKIGKNFGFGRVARFVTTSPERVTEVNLDYLRTGIADLAHLAYPAQLRFKRQQVMDSLRKTAGLTDFPVAETLAAAAPTGYRNKAQIPVRTGADGRLETGFFRKHSHTLLPIKDFYIQAPEIDAVVNFLREEAARQGLSAYDEQSRRGLLRNIVVRRGHATGEMLVVLVVTADKDLSSLAQTLATAFPAVKSVQLNINISNNNAIFGKKFSVLYGDSIIRDRLLGKTFQIAAQSFYQVNTAQAERLYQTAYRMAVLRPTDTIIDAYAGIGTIGIATADSVAQVYGMEILSDAVANARANATANGAANAHYELGTADEVLPKWLSAGVEPDVIFVDPPRKGLDEPFIATAASTAARSIIYISCNPATFARDVTRLAVRGYQLTDVQPVDMFPQTHHIELVAKFINIDRQ